MGNFKLHTGIVCLFLFSGLGFGLTGPHYSGSVFPRPQQVMGEWKAIKFDPKKFEIRIGKNPVKAVILARELLLKRISELSGTGGGEKLVLDLGLFTDDHIRESDRMYRLKFNGLILPPEGYAIRLRPGHIIAAGVDKRGAFYAAATLLQQIGVVDGALGLRVAESNDWPDWPRRFVGDYSPVGRSALEFLAVNKINGYAVQHRREWREFNPDTPQDWGRISAYGPELKAMKEFRDETGLLDFMLIVNIYADRKGPWFDITKEKDITDLIERCRFAAANGFGHIMIGVDDSTPYDEKKQGYICPNQTERDRFDDSVGKAHGYLMKRLYNALNREFPELEWSLCQPAYSTLDHRIAERVENQRYLRDLAAGLPPAVAIVWTGPRVISQKITREDFLAYSRYVNGHRLMFWDNSDCIEPLVPRWVTTFYPEFATDGGGLIYLNNFMFGWGWVRTIFGLAGNAYLWNDQGFNPEEANREAYEKCFGVGTFKLPKAYLDKMRLLDRPEIAVVRKRELIVEMEKLLEKMDKAQIDISRLKGAVSEAKTKYNPKPQEKK